VLFVYLISGCLLLTGAALLAARERSVKLAGVLLQTAVFFIALWLWTEGAREIRRVSGIDLSQEAVILYFLVIVVLVGLGWLTFFLGLRRAQLEENRLLSSTAHPRNTLAAPQEADWQETPPSPQS
jgi:hypothetical protein